VYGQFKYIIAALFLIISFTAVFLFLRKIPLTTSSPKEIVYFENTPDQVEADRKEIALGKALFYGKCASCHNIFKHTAYPSLAGFEERGKWNDRNELYAWIRNPIAYMTKDKYTRSLKEQFGSVMTAFPEITDSEIDAIVDYINWEARGIRIAPLAKQ
jgi:mono/diheme cytochrome c family protein